MAGKGAMHIATTKTFTSGEGRENERRWDEQMLKYKNSKEENNYDTTRMHLNFEIDNEGKVRRLGFNDVELHQRLQKRLLELGFKNFIPTAKNAPNMAARFIFSGDHDTLMKMAFGSQKVKTGKGETNRPLTRNDAIEQWAICLHRWLCKMYGKENVIGLQIHLDERTPHAHALIVPVGTVRKHQTHRDGVKEFYDKDKVMWCAKFGHNKAEWSSIMKLMHTSLYEDVNKVYGMERGDSVEGRNVHHVDKVDYFRRLPGLLAQFEKLLFEVACLSHEEEELADRVEYLRKNCKSLEQDYKQKQTKVKGLTTMVHNKQNDLDKVNEELKYLREELSNKSGDEQRLMARIQVLQHDKSRLEEELEDKQNKLREAKRELKETQEKINADMAKMEETIKKYSFTADERARYSILREAMAICMRDFKSQFSVNRPVMTEMFKDSLIMDLAERSNEIMSCAMLLYLEMIDQATQVAQSHGGGGGGGSAKGWGRNPDEDDRKWALRCLHMAGRMIKPAVRRGMRR